MSAGLEQICQVMADYLSQHGVTAAPAWPAQPRQERDGPLVVVSVRGCRASPSGFQDYLGEHYHPEQGVWQERYGRRAQITLGLDIYAPGQGGAAAVQQTFDALAGALLLGGPAGLQVEELSCGETGYDGQSRCLRRPAQAVCTAYLWAAADQAGQFTDFELRGVVKA